MSRYTKQAIDKTLVYGWDHALGYFYEEWITSDFKDEDGTPFADRCSMFGMQKNEFVDKLHQYRVKESHMEAVALDVPF
jgi:hypothetical protein